MAGITRFKRHVRNWTEDDWRILQYEIADLFTPGQAVTEADLFAGRANEITRLLDTVFEHGKHAIIYGERGIGKTSLARVFYKTVSLPTTRIDAVRVRCDEDDDFSSIWRKVFRSLQYPLDSRVWMDPDHGAPIFPEDIHLEFQDRSMNDMLIIIIDEFDRLTSPKTRAMMANFVKDIADEPFPVTIIFVGIARSIDDLIEAHESIERALRQIEMPRMEEEELRDIVLRRLVKSPISIGGDALWQISFFSRGLPHYTHALGKFAVKQAIARHSLVIEPQDVDAAIEDCIADVEHSLRKAYVDATRATKKKNVYVQALLAAALAETDQLGCFAAADVEDPMTYIMEETYKAPRFQFHLNEFCERSRGPVLQREGERGTYRFRFARPMMQPYVLMQGLSAGLIDREGLERFVTRRQRRLSTEF